VSDLIIQSTASTPEIYFKQSGHLSIKGKSLPEDPKKFFSPLFNWAEDLNVENVQLDVRLEYVNTSSSKNILEFIKMVDSKDNVRHLNLNWFYEIDDLDMLEFGEIIEKKLKRTKASYIEYYDIDDNFRI
jgi:glutaredoxin-related protein